MIDSVISALRSVHFRGKGRLLHAIGNKSGEKICQVFGATFHLDVSDHIQRQIYLGTFEPHETRIVTKYLKPGMTVVDVGANVGYYTALAARFVGNRGRVFSFEPSPYAFQRLSTMVDRNKLSSVSAFQVGLSDGQGQLKLYLGIDSHNHAPTMVPHDGAINTVVPVTTLDDEAERLGISQIDFMKIDVEGYEPKVLAGAKRLLSQQRIKAVLCEFNEYWLRRAGSSPAGLLQLLRDLGLVQNQLLSTHENGMFCAKE